MPIIVSRAAVVGDIPAEIARLKLLIADLEAIAEGSYPSAESLSAAPLLHPWRFGTRELPCLVGSNTGHPVLRGPIIETTDLRAVSADFAWARTLSRLYRLGARLPGRGLS
jgi:hypothetical protein